MSNNRNKKRRIMWVSLSIIFVLIIGGIVFLHQSCFGQTPQGERLERIRKSPNYRDGQFQNLSETTHLTSDKSRLSIMLGMLFSKGKEVHPKENLPVVKTDLNQFAEDENVIVWLGHSSLYMQLNGKRILIDPVLKNASPVSFINKAFKATYHYTADDIPAIDFLIITHDHFDHLEYKTVVKLKDRTGKVICPLGVGQHFERWKFDNNRIVELDWNERADLDSGLVIHCLPSRHFSGRGLSPNKTLWAGYMFQTPSQNIYLSGDGGYDTHFAAIAKQFGKIDFAIMENGQYSKNWSQIHLMPEDLVKAVKDMQPVRFMTVHNSLYALSKHPWYEPLDAIAEAAARDSLPLLTPVMGEPVFLNDTVQTFGKWWREL